MIRDFRETYNISETEIINEISNQLADIDIQLDNNAKKYNLKNVNELLVQQKLLNNLKNKMDNNEEVYVKKEQQGGDEQYGGLFDIDINDTAFSNAAISASKSTPAGAAPNKKYALVILDLQSVLKYKPSGNTFVEDDALQALETELSPHTRSILHIICDDNWSWNKVVDKLPRLSTWTSANKFHCANGFTDIKNCVKEILDKYKEWIVNDPGNTHIYYLSRNWNKSKQIRDLNEDNNLELQKNKNDSNIYEKKNVKVEFMDKDKISTSGNYMDQLQNVRSIRESMNNPKWMSPFLIHPDQFKSRMTRIRVNNGIFQKY